MLPNREGLFHAYPVDIGVGETRENKLLQVAICYHLFEELASGEWVDCSGDNFEITGYHILEKRDHALNQTTIEALKAAFGWDGRDPFWLQDQAAELMQKPVQLKIGFEEYNGTTSPRVQFLNSYGSRPAGVTKGDDQLRRNVANRLGAKFRALAGGTPANAPKPGGKLTPPAKPAPPKPTAQADPATSTMEEAWGAFVNEYTSKPGGNDEDMRQQWFAVIAQLFSGKQVDELTPADWGRMLVEGPSNIVPF